MIENSETEAPEATDKVGGRVNTLISNLVYGKVPAGKSCFASEECGINCLVSEGKTTDEPYSCGAARVFETFGC